MKTLKHFVVAILLLITMASCATLFTGGISGSAAISSNNFKIIKTATGKAQTTTILGLGGSGTNALVASAKKNLLQNYPLKDGQALANITVDFRNSNYLGILIVTQHVTVTADIVEFK